MANREESWKRLVDQRCQDCEKHCKEAWIVEVLSAVSTDQQASTAPTTSSNPVQQLRQRLMDLFRKSSNPGLPPQQRRESFSALKDLRQRLDEMIARGKGLGSANAASGVSGAASNGNSHVTPAASIARTTAPAPVSTSATVSNGGVGSVASVAPKSVAATAPARQAPPTATAHRTTAAASSFTRKPDVSHKENANNNKTPSASKPAGSNGMKPQSASATATAAPVRPSQLDPPAKRKSSIADLANASAATVQEAASALPPNFSYTGTTNGATSANGSKHPSPTNAQRPRSGSTSQQTDASALPPPPPYERRSQQVPAKKTPATTQASGTTGNSATTNKRSKSPTPTPATATNSKLQPNKHTASTPASKKTADPPSSSDSGKKTSVAKTPSVQKEARSSPTTPATPATLNPARSTMNQSSTNMSPQMQAQQLQQQQLQQWAQMNWGMQVLWAQQLQENPALAGAPTATQLQQQQVHEAYRAQIQRQVAQMQMAQQQMFSQQPSAPVAATQNGNVSTTAPAAKPLPKLPNQSTPQPTAPKAAVSSSTTKPTSSQSTVNGTQAGVSKGVTTPNQSAAVSQASSTTRKDNEARNGEAPANELTNSAKSKSTSKGVPSASTSSSRSTSSSDQPKTAALSSPTPSAATSSNSSTNGTKRLSVANQGPSRPQVMRPTHRSTSTSSTTSQRHSRQSPKLSDEPEAKKRKVDAASAAPPEPDIVTSLASTTVTFAKDEQVGNLSFAAAQDPRGSVTLRFRPREMSQGKQKNTSDRLQRWEPTWQVIETVAAGVTSPIDEYVSVEPPHNNPNTAAKIVLRDLAAIAANSKVMQHMKWGKNNTTTLKHPQNADMFLLLRMLPLNPPPLDPLDGKADCHLWPKGTFITVDSKPVKIGQRKQANHIKTLWEYNSCALDLGHLIQSPTKPPVVAMCCYDSEPFIYTVSFCKYWSPSVITKGLLSSRESALTRRTYQESIDKAMRLISNQAVVIGEEDDVSENIDESVRKLIFSLQDPVSKGTMVTPVRGRECIHWQCFDLEYYMRVNAPVYGGRWRCGCCERFVSYLDLEVCAVTQKALKMFEKQVSSEQNRVELRADQSLRLLPPQKLRYHKVKQQSDGGNSGSEKPGKIDVEIIDLV